MSSSKITMLKGDTTPEVFCAKLLEMAGEIENVACVVLLKDSSTAVFSTAMSHGDTAWLRWVFDQDFRPECMDGP